MWQGGQWQQTLGFGRERYRDRDGQTGRGAAPARQLCACEAAVPHTFPYVPPAAWCTVDFFFLQSQRRSGRSPSIWASFLFTTQASSTFGPSTEPVLPKELSQKVDTIHRPGRQLPRAAQPLRVTGLAH
jgi:hypothetical protein